MSCKRFRPAIAAHAGGAPLAAAAARHLAECGACRRTLDAHVQLLAEVDGELERTLSIAASPDLVARAARQARDAGEQTAQRWVPAALWAGVGLAAVIVLIVWTGGAFRPFDRLGAVPSAVEGRLKPEATQTDGGRETGPADRPRAVANGGADKAVVRLSKAVEATTSKRPVPTKTQQARKPPVPDCVASGFSRKAAACAPRPPGATEPPVIVDPRRALALARLRELMTEGRLDGDMLPPPRTPDAVLAELIVAPLAVSEIKVPDVESVSRPPAASPEAAVNKESSR